MGDRGQSDIGGVDELVSATDVADRRDELAAELREHAGEVAREVAMLQGGDYGQQVFETGSGTWTLKYEGGDVDYLRFEPRSGVEIYAVSSKQQPEPDALARALDDYGAFVAAYNEYVASMDGRLEDVEPSFPEVASTAALVEDRDRILRRVREAANAMASELHRYEGEYGTYATTVSGTRWELKWDGDVAAYLRVGGSDGTYLLSQYQPPPVTEVRRLVADVPAFVEAFNEEVAALEAGLAAVSFTPES
ncbi:hypothetical protein OB905_05375 [Halobacteria archaeon AArc-dxtr1]|nr:hypothetical protein [Halobacteria archaeon AArc-dxtr1]